MDINVVKALIDTMGFPIFICVVLLWFIKNTLNKHSEMMQVFSKSIDANTESIKLLIEKLKQ